MRSKDQGRDIEVLYLDNANGAGGNTLYAVGESLIGEEADVELSV